MTTRGRREIPIGESDVESDEAESGRVAPERVSEPPEEAVAMDAEGGGSLEANEAAEEAEAAGAVEEDIAALQEEIGARDMEILRLQDRLLRLQADFDNYRRREMRARASSSARAKGDLVGRLLTALDDMRRVAGLDAATTATSAVIDGVRLVERKLLELLRQEGLEPVGRTGEAFDPNVHEAIGMWPAPRPQLEGTIAAVPVQGYRFQDQLLRPAQVQVYEHRGGTGEQDPDLASG